MKSDLLFPAEVVMTPAAATLHTPTSILAPAQDSPIDLTIFVSCYEEEEFIVQTLNSVRAALQQLPSISYELIVIDDCSRDRSAALVEEYIGARPEDRVVLVRNKSNRGLAQNYVDAAFMGKGKYYRLICGDNAEPKEMMIAVFRELGTADILVPYYTVNEGKRLDRRLLSRTYSGLVNAISGFRLHYYNGLAVHRRHNVMRWHPTTRGFGFQAEVICRLLDEGFSYKEIPLKVVERKGATSSRALTVRNLLSVAHTLVELGFRRISRSVYGRK